MVPYFPPPRLSHFFHLCSCVQEVHLPHPISPNPSWPSWFLSLPPQILPLPSSPSQHFIPLPAAHQLFLTFMIPYTVTSYITTLQLSISAVPWLYDSKSSTCIHDLHSLTSSQPSMAPFLSSPFLTPYSSLSQPHIFLTPISPTFPHLHGSITVIPVPHFTFTSTALHFPHPVHS